MSTDHGVPGSNPTFSPSFRDDFLFPLLKNSKCGVDDRGRRFRSGSPLTNYPHATATCESALSQCGRVVASSGHILALT